MTENITKFLQLPEKCVLKKRITKAFFKRNFILTLSEKSLLDDAEIISSVQWFATISPGKCNIPAVDTNQLSWAEFQVIVVESGLGDLEKNAFKIADLIQKFIPYPIVLFLVNPRGFFLNTADKRQNQSDHTRLIIEKMYFSQFILHNEPSPPQQQFINSLGFPRLEKSDLETCYNNFTQRIIALQAASFTYQFITPDRNRTKEDLRLMECIALLEKEIAGLMKQVQKETQLNQRVQLNIQVQQKRQQIEELKIQITQ